MLQPVSIVEHENIRYIVVGNEAFDWGVDEEHFTAAQVIGKSDPIMLENFIGEIQQHFLACFAEFIGRPTNMAEINKSIEDGYIDC